MKRVLTVIVGLMLAATLTACGGGNKEVDVLAVGQDLSSKILYQDELMEMDIETAMMFIELSGFTPVKGVAYEGSGATAEEIIAIECENADDADKAASALNARVAEQIECFTDYVPEELVKLNNAVVIKNGKYAFLSVSNDPDTAKQIINGYF